MADIGTLTARLVADSKGFVAGMTQAQTSLAATTTQTSGMQQATAKLGQVAPLALAAVGAAAIKMSSDYEHAFSQMSGLVGVAEDDLQRFDAHIKNIAVDVAVGPQELADAMFFITSAGLEGADAMDALTQSAKASTAGLGETEVIADAVTSALNAYGTEALSAEQATDVLVATVREGKAPADSIAQSLGKVIPIASEMGVSFDQVGASIAALTRIGATARESTTALRSVMTGLANPSQQAEERLSAVGLSAAKLREQIREEGLISTLLELKESFGGNTAALAEVFPNVRALTGVLGLVGNNAEEAEAIFNSLADTTGATADAFDEAAETAGFKFEQAMVALQVALIDLGDTLAPTAAAIAGLVAESAPLLDVVVSINDPLLLLADAIDIVGGSAEDAEGDVGLFADAVGVLAPILKAGINPAGALHDAWDDLKNGGGDVVGTVDDVKNGLVDLEGEVLSADVAFFLLKDDLDLAGAVAARRSPDFHAAAEGAAEIADAGDDAAESMEELDAAFGGLNQTLSVADAMIKAEQAIRGFAEAHREAAADGEINRDEQLSLNAEMVDMIGTIRDEAAVLNDLGEAGVDVSGAVSGLHDKLAALAAFIPEDMQPVWQSLTRDILDMPDEQVTEPKAPGIGARQAEFANLKRGVENVPPRAYIDVGSNVWSTLTAFQQLPHAIRLAATAADQAFANAAAARRQLDGRD